METHLIIIAVIVLAAVVVLMMIGIPLVYTIGICAVAGAYFGWGTPGLSKMGLIMYQQFFNLQWTPLILFTFLACIIEQTQIGNDIFKAAHRWLSRLPGGLIVASIGAEAGMAACIGSSTTTALVVGKVSVPEMVKLGYNKAFGVGTVLCGGALGPLIPPSIPLIVYAFMARQSIGELFIAGVIPGILLAVMLAGFAVIACTIRPALGPRAEAFSWKERFTSLKLVWPVVILMIGILGGIYLGVMTANESAGVACVIMMAIAAISYKFRLPQLIEAMKNTAIVGGMIMFMVSAVMILTYVVATSGLAQTFASDMISLGLSKWVIIIMINILLLILGCFVDALTMILLTLPFFVPLVSGLGFDLVWFGILLCVNSEIGLITPPMGLNLFIMRGVFNIPIGELLRGATPSICVLILFLGILIAFPEISIWLPGLMRGS